MSEPEVLHSPSVHPSKLKRTNLVLCALGLLLISGVALAWRAHNRVAPVALAQQEAVPQGGVQQGGVQQASLQAATFISSNPGGNLLRNGNFQDDWITILPETKNHHWAYSSEFYNRRDYNPDTWLCKGDCLPQDYNRARIGKCPEPFQYAPMAG